MNEENKEELEQEDIAEVDSLVNYYVSRKVDPLPAIKQAIIRQNVAFSYEWFVTKANLACLYVCFSNHN